MSESEEIERTTFVRQHNPATGEFVAEVPETPLEDIPEIFNKAREAQKEWAKKSFKERGVHMYKMQKYLHENIKQIARALVESTGKTFRTALNAEVVPCIMSIDWNCRNVSRILADQKINTDTILFGSKKTYKTFVPIGVIGVITPWNYPLSLPFEDLVMCLITGNAVVLKCATPTIYVGKIIDDIVKAGELPEGLFTHVVVPGSKVGKLFLDNGANKLMFTGSVGVGKQLSKLAADYLVPCSLELGGNDPAVVLPDANLEYTTNGIIFSSFSNTGQTCAAIERCYVHEKIYDQFVELMAKKVNSMKHGIPTEDCEAHIGSMTKKSQLDLVITHYEDALEKGARVVARSRPVEGQDLGEGLFFPATVVVNVNDEMLLMKEETFGPILPIIKFSDVDEVIAKCNDDKLALTASVWTRSVSKGWNISKQLDGGVVIVNGHGYTHARPGVEWGGWKESGIGRTHGSQGLLELVNHKIIDYDLMPQSLIKRDFWGYDATPEESKSGNEVALKVEKFLYYNTFFTVFHRLWYLLLMIFPLLIKMMTSWTPIEEEEEEEEEGEDEEEIIIDQKEKDE